VKGGEVNRTGGPVLVGGGEEGKKTPAEVRRSKKEDKKATRAARPLPVSKLRGKIVKKVRIAPEDPFYPISRICGQRPKGSANRGIVS